MLIWNNAEIESRKVDSLAKSLVCDLFSEWFSQGLTS
jgi:hypothetical protein